jgi:hypothetical protein
MQRVVGTTIHLQRRQGRGRRTLGVGRIGIRRQQLHPRERLHRCEELIEAQEQVGGRQQWTAAIAAQKVEARARVAPEALDRFRDVALQAHQGALRQIVGDDRGAIEEQREVVLDAGREHAVADVLVELAARGVALELLAEALPKMGARVLVRGKLACGQQPHLLDLVDGALRVDVEGANAVHFVVEEVDAVGQGAAHGEQVDQPAAEAELARGHDLRHVLVARQYQLLAQRLRRDGLALLEKEAVGREELDRRQAVQRRGHRHHDDVAGLVGDLVQRREPLGYQVLVRREAVVGQGLPVGQEVHAQLRREEADLLDQPLAVSGAGGEHGERLSGRGEPRQREGIAGSDEPANARALAGRGKREELHAEKRRHYRRLRTQDSGPRGQVSALVEHLVCGRRRLGANLQG